MSKLKEANIKVVMLTGDKQETAISIARQAGVISEHLTVSQLMILSAKLPSDTSDPKALEKSMSRLQKKINQFVEKCVKRRLDLMDDELTTEEVTTVNREALIARNMNIKVSRIGGTSPFQSPENALIINGDALEMCLHEALIEDFILLFQ
ncbi:P-type ATPase [Reticulomyxa filosa]|uniref:P-type ATPase n=1 Tax=Reticulomyxa filosa TaxID=46433 RepID=X6LR95_RETFI|nr:P-type ATPase [Reticulomyxa filosa]|eukprot:ETO04164.1 P-type ATPase [Reticulomyxa filosa]